MLTGVDVGVSAGSGESREQVRAHPGRSRLRGPRQADERDQHPAAFGGSQPAVPEREAKAA